MARQITFSLNEGDPGQHGHVPTWCTVRMLPALEGMAEVIAGGSCSSCWQVGHDRDLPPLPIGTVAKVSSRWDSDSIVDEFPLEVVGGVVGIQLLVEFLGKDASFADLRSALMNSAEAEAGIL